MGQKYQVYFKYNAHYHTKSVEVVGDFNDWAPGQLALEDEDGDNVWWGSTELSSGIYKYKFLIDGKHYSPDQNNPHRDHSEGMDNSIIEVGEARLKGDFLHEAGDIDFYSDQCLYVRAKLNFQTYSSVKLIMVADDYIQTVNGFELYRDEIYSYQLFKSSIIFTARHFLYYFELEKNNHGKEYFGLNGAVSSEWEVENFEYLRPENDVFQAPDWVKDAIFYQIFPERFFNGNSSRNPKKIAPPTQNPEWNTFYGGDIEGIIKKLEHVQELGANTLYLNPIFEAPSTHKYDTADYMKIDPHFGDEDVFRKLTMTLKKNNMRLILDGVFNHTGTEFRPFKDIEKNGKDSKYLEWFNVHKFPLIEDGKANYDCWWDFPQHPELNVDTPVVKDYLLEVGRNWIKKGADGWRLDVPNEIDHWFWKEFRQTVKQANPDAYIVGEIWNNALPWLEGDEFDSVMNYRFRDACIEFFALRKTDASLFIKQIGSQIFDYPMQANFSMFNLLSSHDTARFFTVSDGDYQRVRLAIGFQFTYLGAPSIYYGEEIGMEGGKDPDNRRFMNWEKRKWNKDIWKTYRKLIKMRQDNPVLRHGDIRFIYCKGNTVGFERFDENDRLTIFINNSDENINIDITHYAGNGDFRNIYKDYPLKRKRAFTLYANDFVILRKTKER